MCRGLYWILAPFLVICLIAFPMLVPAWTPTRIIVMICLEAFCLGLLIGLYDMSRFQWALRAVGALVFIAYVSYLVIMIFTGAFWAGSRSQPSVLSAVGGLVIIGVPSLMLALRGFGSRANERFVLFATSNPHKLDEVDAILLPHGIEVAGLDSLDEDIPEPEEDGDTFEANARIKAIAYAKATGMVCLADDSGLEVDALGGRPGVHSARFAGVGNTRAERDNANNAQLLRELKDVPPDRRTARFVCAMCLANAQGHILAETRGEFAGVIIDQPRGSNGFGYDPLLFLTDRGCTSAELSAEEKNARSHRGAAARLMAEHLLRLIPGTS